jgi:anti-sigma regulatory factor (Ser/Thr protein kinase)
MRVREVWRSPMDAFRHEALFYGDGDEYVAGTVPFAQEALAADEPLLIAVGADKRRLIEDALGAEAHRAAFVDMAVLGRNPGRIISAWHDFVDNHSGRYLRGIGEPVWPGRDPVELTECEHHESLLNAAFGTDQPWRLICPYDTSALSDEVLAAAERTHPHIVGARGDRESETYIAPSAGSGIHRDGLPSPSTPPELLNFGELARVRGYVAERAGHTGVPGERAADLIVAVNELASNSIRHGGGEGTLAVWDEPDSLVCEVRDRGRIESALTGRRRPAPEDLSGRGLWLVHELCDLVQIRSGEDGTVARIRVRKSA